MFAGLTDARLATVTRRERLCELGGLEYILNPLALLDTRLHPGLDPGLDPGVGFSLECKCNVPNRSQGIISMLRVGRWADFVSQAELRKKVEIGDPGVVPRRYSRVSVFPSIFGPDSTPFRVWTV